MQVLEETQETISSNSTSWVLLQHMLSTMSSKENNKEQTTSTTPAPTEAEQDQEPSNQNNNDQDQVATSSVFKTVLPDLQDLPDILPLTIDIDEPYDTLDLLTDQFPLLSPSYSPSLTHYTQSSPTDEDEPDIQHTTSTYSESPTVDYSDHISAYQNHSQFSSMARTASYIDDIQPNVSSSVMNLPNDMRIDTNYFSSYYVQN